MLVSHYTKKNVSEELLFKKSPFRLSLLNTGNDPEEGKTLFHYLFPQKEMSKQVEEYGAFAGCFIFNNDSLNQFRLYGKTDDKEGTGVSITLKEQFFNTEEGRNILSILQDNGEEILPDPSSLFRCVYIDPETNTIVSLGQKEKCVFDREGQSLEDYEEYKESISTMQQEVNDELEN